MTDGVVEFPEAKDGFWQLAVRSRCHGNVQNHKSLRKQRHGVGCRVAVGQAQQTGGSRHKPQDVRGSHTNKEETEVRRRFFSRVRCSSRGLGFLFLVETNHFVSARNKNRRQPAAGLFFTPFSSRPRLVFRPCVRRRAVLAQGEPSSCPWRLRGLPPPATKVPRARVVFVLLGIIHPHARQAVQCGEGMCV